MKKFKQGTAAIAYAFSSDGSHADDTIAAVAKTAKGDYRIDFIRPHMKTPEDVAYVPFAFAAGLRDFVTESDEISNRKSVLRVLHKALDMPKNG